MRKNPIKEGLSKRNYKFFFGKYKTKYAKMQKVVKKCKTSLKIGTK